MVSIGEPARAAWAYSGLLVAIFVPVAHSLYNAPWSSGWLLPAGCIGSQPGLGLGARWMESLGYLKIISKLSKNQTIKKGPNLPTDTV